jgi:hypothetical protein
VLRLQIGALGDIGDHVPLFIALPTDCRPA